MALRLVRNRLGVGVVVRPSQKKNRYPYLGHPRVREMLRRYRSINHGTVISRQEHGCTTEFTSVLKGQAIVAFIKSMPKAFATSNVYGKYSYIRVFDGMEITLTRV